MSTLTGNKIKDTYDGLLKTSDSTTGLPSSGQTSIEDGVGNTSALSLGKTSNGATISGDLTADKVKTPEIEDQDGDLSITTPELLIDTSTETVIKSDITEIKGKTGDTIGTTTIKNELKVDQIANISGNDEDAIQVESKVNFTEDLTGDGSVLFQGKGGFGVSENTTGIDFDIGGKSKLNGDTIINGNVDVTGSANQLNLTESNARLGIRTSNPTIAFECLGAGRISGRVNFHNGAIETVGFNNSIKLGNYGSSTLSSGTGNVPTIAQKTDPDNAYKWNPKYTLAVGSEGNLIEDEKIFTIQISPSYWGANNGGSGWKGAGNLFNFTIGAAQIVVITEVQYLRRAQIFSDQPNYPPVRGGYGGTDEEPYIYITTGQLDPAQIWNMSLGEYRENDGLYVTNKTLKYDLVTENQTLTFRAGFMPQLFLKNLNRPGNGVMETRPNYNVYLKIKYKLINATAFASTTDKTLS